MQESWREIDRSLHEQIPIHSRSYTGLLCHVSRVIGGKALGGNLEYCIGGSPTEDKTWALLACFVGIEISPRFVGVQTFSEKLRLITVDLSTRDCLIGKEISDKAFNSVLKDFYPETRLWRI